MKINSHKENTKEKKEQLLIPKYDIIFHSLFHNHRKELTSNFISALLETKVKVVNMDKDRHLIKHYPDEKLGILDLRTELEDGTICNIEVQLVKQKDIIKRLLFYSSKEVYTQVGVSETYSKIQKTIIILIADFELEVMKTKKKLGVKWGPASKDEEHTILTEEIEWVIIEIPKAKRILKENPKDEIAQWMMFLDSPNSMEVSKIMNENKEIKEAVDELEKISQNKELRRIAELKEKYIRDEMSVREGARQEGIQQGIEQSKKEIVKEMLNKEFDTKTISEITKLPIEEIEKIKLESNKEDIKK